MQENLQLKHINRELDNISPRSLPVDTTRVVHAGAGRIPTIQAGIEDFELRSDTATYIGISDGKGGINIIHIAEVQHLERRADLPLATLEDSNKEEESLERQRQQVEAEELRQQQAERQCEQAEGEQFRRQQVDTAHRLEQTELQRQRDERAEESLER